MRYDPVDRKRRRASATSHHARTADFTGRRRSRRTQRRRRRVHSRCQDLRIHGRVSRACGLEYLRCVSCLYNDACRDHHVTSAQRTYQDLARLKPSRSLNELATSLPNCRTSGVYTVTDACVLRAVSSARRITGAVHPSFAASMLIASARGASLPLSASEGGSPRHRLERLLRCHDGACETNRDSRLPQIRSMSAPT